MITDYQQIDRKIAITRRSVTQYLLLFAVLLGLALQSSLAQANGETSAHSASDAKAATAQLEQLKQEISQISNALQNQRAEQSKQQKKLEKVDQNLSSLGKQVFELEQRNQQLGKAHEKLQKQQVELENASIEKQEGIGERLKVLYQLQGQSQLSQLLSQRNPSDSQRNIVALKTINQKTARELEQLNQLRQQQRHNADQLAANRQEAEKVLSNLNRKQRDLEAQRLKRIASLTALEKKLQHSEAAHHAKLENKAQLEVLLAKLAKSAALRQFSQQQQQTRARVTPRDTAQKGANTFSFSQAKGKMSWPAAGKKNLVFGQRKSGSERRWQGITIAGDTGSTVRTIHSGTIIFADYLAAQGLLIIVDHGSGYWSLYGRNESLLRQVGDPVEAGEAIATIGASGGHKEAALYFEIRQSGTPQNPSQWCSSRA